MEQHQLKALALEMSAALGEMPPIPVELVCATGQIFTVEAMNLARTYDAATNGQRQALDQIAKAFKAGT